MWSRRHGDSVLRHAQELGQRAVNRAAGTTAKKSKTGNTAKGDTSLSLEAENLYLREELDRLRLSQSGAHRASTMVEALQALDAMGDEGKAEDAADEIVSMYNQTMLVRWELLDLVERFGQTLGVFEERLHALGVDEQAQVGSEPDRPRRSDAELPAPVPPPDVAEPHREDDDHPHVVEFGDLVVMSKRGDRDVEPAT